MARDRSATRFFFAYLFLIGTLIAAIGWLAEWKHLVDDFAVFRYSAVIALIGHAAQVIGAFFSLITPDRDQERNQE